MIPPAYEHASTFKEGLAAVTVEGRWGYIGTSGEMVIEPRFDRASFFKEGLAHVEVGGRSLYIDRHGRTVLETSFKGGLPFREGVTPVYIEDSSRHRSFLSFLARWRAR